MADDSPPSDQDLVRAALRDPNAYAHIVRRYEARLQRYIARMLGRGHPQIEDILQDVFLKAYVNLNDYDSQRSFSPWIYRIAHNETMSLFRRRRSMPQMLTGEDGQRVLDRIMDRDATEEWVDDARNETRLKQALSTLEQRYRDVLVLRFLEERSYDDIADILQLPMGTVATLVSRGKQRLRKAYEALDL